MLICHVFVKIEAILGLLPDLQTKIMNQNQINPSALISLVVTNAVTFLGDVSDHWIFKVSKFFSLGFSIYNVYIWIQGKTFTKKITSSDWQKSDDGYKLTIPASTHKKGKIPDVSVFYKNQEGNLVKTDTVETMADPNNGDVIINSLRNFEGLCMVNENDLKKFQS
jgi:hypothetical protein